MKKSYLHVPAAFLGMLAVLQLGAAFQEPYVVDSTGRGTTQEHMKASGGIEATVIPIIQREALPAQTFPQVLANALITIRFVDDATHTALPSRVWQVNVVDHGEWLKRNAYGRFTVDQKEIAFYLSDHLPEHLSAPTDAVLQNVSTQDVTRGRIIGTVADGFVLDTVAAASAIASAIERGDNSVMLPVKKQSGSLFVHTAHGGMWLTRLSTGRSNFAHSPPGRIANVQKAINERLNGVVIPADALFSMNATLGRFVDGAHGWANSLIIVNGKDLVEAPGGGICQAATTMFRAAVHAGLPIDVRANHSLYVSYYKEGGVGIDATVLPGKQDFSFRNDTGNPLVVLGHTSGNDATIDLYGIPDDRTVSLKGPYFTSTAALDTLFNGSTLRTNQIGWQQHITFADGRSTDNAIVSTYRALPRHLADEYRNPTGGNAL